MLTKRISLRALRAAGFLVAVVLGALVVATAGSLAFFLGISGDARAQLYVAVVGIVATAALVGLAAAVGGHTRTALGAAAVVAISVGGVILWPEPEFDATAFRRAHAAGDDEAVEVQARRAASQNALVGRSKDEIRRVLGSPDQATRREWAWYVGTVNDTLGPGDEGLLYVRFRGDRALSAEVLP